MIKQPAPYIPVKCASCACKKLQWSYSVPVGWNCTNSISSFASPALVNMADPSPVHECADVHEKYALPYPLNGVQDSYYLSTICSFSSPSSQYCVLGMDPVY